jgi:tetratricopeptide (TPR) repeat protein
MTARQRWLVAAVLVAVVVLAFLPVLSNGFVNWDDDLNLTDNPNYRGFSWQHLAWMATTVHGGHYQPLTWVSFALDHALWGLAPAGYHLTNLLLHAASAVLCWRLIVVLLRRALAPAPSRLLVLELGAAAGALFFAVHPLRVESVAWASERRDVLSGVFYLATLVAYVRMAETRDANRARRWYVASLVLFTLSLAAKAWGMTLPLVLVLLDVYPLRRRALAEKIPYAALALGAAVLAFIAQRAQPAMHTLAQHGPLERVAQAAYGLAFYVWKTILPSGLHPAYLLEGHLDPTAPRYLVAFLAVAAITTVVLMRGRPWAAVAWATYAVIVSPVLGFVQTGPQIAADRYTYLACLPFAAVAGAAVYRASDRRAVWAIAAMALALLGVLTFRQSGIWRDSRTLWEHTLALDPANWIAYTNRGVARHAAGDLDGALADYGTALRYNPGYPEALNDRGIVRYLRGDVAGALADYDAAIRVRPDYADAYANRGLARQIGGDAAGAVADFDAAIRLRPAYAKAYYSRANLRLGGGDIDGALADYTAAIQADPRYAEAYNNRATARRARGDLAGALADYERALALVAPGGPEATMIRENIMAVRAGRQP